MNSEFLDRVKNFWEEKPCGIGLTPLENIQPKTKEWFQAIEKKRYELEPFIHTIAQFHDYHGKNLLEVGTGVGTDHLQWARAGAKCYGVDLTSQAIELTQANLAHYGFSSTLKQLDAERLPFENDFFDIVYSWGVIHHTEHPEKIIDEILRVLKPEGTFIGMMYQRHSIFAFKLWVKYALLRVKPWLNFKLLFFNHMESKGTKAYTIRELGHLFSGFRQFNTTPLLTPYDTAIFPRYVSQFFPSRWGLFIAIRAKK